MSPASRRSPRIKPATGRPASGPLAPVGPVSVEPVTVEALADRIASLADARRSAPGRLAVRLGVDGPVQADTAWLADLVAGRLTALAIPVARVSAEHFLRARSLRLEWGRDDPDAFLQGWYDVGALRRDVLDPLGPGGSGQWLPRLRDPVTDRPFRDRPEPAAPGTVAVLEGRFLARPPLRAGLDVLVHLDVDAQARARRVPAEEQARVLPAWQRYLTETAPAEQADLVIRFNRPSHPAVLRPLSARPRPRR